MNRLRDADSRAGTARALQRVLAEGRSLTRALPAERNAADRARAQAICYGVLRQLPLLRRLLAGLLEKPLKSRDADLEALLLAAIYELGWMRTADHAVLHGAVAAARTLGKPWAAGLVNAVLRTYQRGGKPRAADDLSDEERLLHPDWLIEALRAAWPDDYRSVIAANNEQGPLWLRVNATRTDVPGYRQRLDAAGIAAMPDPWSRHALKLEKPRAVERLPGFAAGEVSVQDLAAQLAAPLLGARAGDRVLDACAAPGGKTAHVLELCPDLDLTAVDLDPSRAERIGETLQRLGLQARVVVADVAAGSWWDGRRFERILLDAPCSASGVIRRHPDIKWLRRPADIGALAAIQRELFETVWPMLARGGRLLYATCSVLPEENQRQVGAFLAAHGDAAELPIEAQWGRAVCHGRQILPGENDADGFYYALLEKR